MHHKQGVCPSGDPFMNRDDTLATAANLISGDRHNTYGPYAENAARIAAGWSQILGIEVQPRQVPMMMAWLKIVRLIPGPHEDSWVDLAGYAGLGGEVDSKD